MTHMTTSVESREGAASATTPDFNGELGATMRMVMHYRPWIPFVLTILCSFIVGATPGYAQSDDPFNDLDVPWYDSSRGEIEAIPLEESPESNANFRDSTWEYVPRNQNAAQNNVTAPTTTTPTGPTWLTRLLQWAFWILVGLIVMSVLIWIAWLILRQEGGRRREAPNMDDLIGPKLDPAKIEDLPFEVRSGNADFLELARRAQANGQLRDAMVYLFSYVLLKLDQHEWIELTRGKTNRTYLRELRSQSAMQALLERFVINFEDCFFGNLPVQSEELQSRWKDLDEFHQQVIVRQG